jgi:GTPase
VPVLEVWNKLDLVPPSAREPALRCQETNRSGVFPISALTGEGVPALLDAISDAFAEAKTAATLSLPFSEGRARARLHAMGVVTRGTAGRRRRYKIDVLWTPRQEAQWRRGLTCQRPATITRSKQRPIFAETSS